MTGTVFVETLRRSWRQMIYWGLGLFIWGVYPFVMIPDQAGLDGYAEPGRNNGRQLAASVWN